MPSATDVWGNVFREQPVTSAGHFIDSLGGGGAAGGAGLSAARELSRGGGRRHAESDDANAAEDGTGCLSVPTLMRTLDHTYGAVHGGGLHRRPREKMAKSVFALTLPAAAVSQEEMAAGGLTKQERQKVRALLCALAAAHAGIAIRFQPCSESARDVDDAVQLTHALLKFLDRIAAHKISVGEVFVALAEL